MIKIHVLKSLTPFGLCLILFLFTSCISYKEVEVNEIKSLELVNNDMQSGRIKTVITVTNPNKYNIKVTDYDINAYVNNNDLGKIMVEEKILLLANSRQDYTLTFKPDVSKILSALPSLLLMGGGEAALKGNARVKAGFYSKKFNIDLKKQITMDDFQ